MNNNLFFELIRVSIATQNSLSRKPSAEEWQSLYAMAKMQSLVGLCFAGVQKLVNCENEGYCGMPEMLYFTWMGMAAKIQQRNELMDDKTKESLSFFREKGFPCQVLKGQGIASLYGDLRNLRQSGDIDVWLNGNRDSVYQLSLESFGNTLNITQSAAHLNKRWRGYPLSWHQCHRCDRKRPPLLVHHS